MRSSITAFRSLATAVLWASCGIGSAIAGEQPGLRADAGSLPWPRVAARLGLSVSPLSSTPTLRPDAMSDAGTERSSPQVQALNVLGDVYIMNSHRFRATGGVLLGARALPWSSSTLVGGPLGASLSVGRRVSLTPDESTIDSGDASSTVPYLGVGYSDASARGGWGFSADVGVLALTPRPAVRLGRVFTGQQNFDEYLRELRLTPSVQVGVSYSF